MLTPMPATVVLHVGLMKSGTTFLQGQLFAQRESLAAAGVLVPGDTWTDQVKGVSKALKAGSRLDGVAAWQALAEPARTHPGTSVVSMEFLGPAEPGRIAALVASLRPARVEAVVTVRDLNRSLVAQWQETVQNGRWWTFADYLAAAEAGRPGGPGTTEEAGRTFWRQQDVVRIATTWAAATDACAVVIVPPPGAPAAELWHRFGRVAGLPASEPVPAGANSSLGAASLLALRAMNEVLAERGKPFPARSRVRKGLLAKQVLASRRREEASVGLPVAAWVRDTAADLVAEIERLRAGGLRVEGDLAELAPVDVPGIDPATVTAAEVRAAAVAGVAGLAAGTPLATAGSGGR